MTTFVAPLTPVLDVPVLHVVTSDEIVAREDFVDVACAIMTLAGARVALHLRTGWLSSPRLQSLADGLAAVQELTGAWLVVTEKVDVAHAARARGVQLTSRSMGVAQARRAAPGLALGASAHAVGEGIAAATAGADWLVAARTNAEHVNAAPDAPAGDRPSHWFEPLSQAVHIPVIVIGGVRPADVGELRRAGASGVAVIRGIWDAPNAE